MVAPVTVREGDLHTLLGIVSDHREDLPPDGLPWSLLHDLMGLIRCDEMTSDRWKRPAGQQASSARRSGDPGDSGDRCEAGSRSRRQLPARPDGSCRLLRTAFPYVIGYAFRVRRGRR